MKCLADVGRDADADGRKRAETGTGLRTKYAGGADAGAEKVASKAQASSESRGQACAQTSCGGHEGCTERQSVGDQVGVANYRQAGGQDSRQGSGQTGGAQGRYETGSRQGATQDTCAGEGRSAEARAKGCHQGVAQGSRETGCGQGAYAKAAAKPAAAKAAVTKAAKPASSAAKAAASVEAKPAETKVDAKPTRARRSPPRKKTVSLAPMPEPISSPAKDDTAAPAAKTPASSKAG